MTANIQTQKKVVEVLHVGRAPHTSQVITGLLLLAKRGEIILSYKMDGLKIKLPSFSDALVIAKIEDSVCVFDVLDGFNLELNELESFLSMIDFYFKRSYSTIKIDKLINKGKVFELGLNYYVTTKGDLSEKRSIKQSIKKIIKVLMGIDHLIYKPTIFEKRPNYKINKEPRILFLTRLWNPKGEPSENFDLSDELKEERKHINEMRINLIKELQKKYGDKFTGGLYNTKFAKEIAPELILSRKFTSKKKYLRIMQSSDICIGSAGLHESVGWKTAEYVAASKAIIVEKMVYSAPGFKDGINFLEFKTTNECIEHIDTLINNKKMIVDMQHNNFQYYEIFLKPDKLIKNIIEKIYFLKTQKE